MSRFYPYSPEQGYLIPPNVVDELGSDHLCFFIRRVVCQLDLSIFVNSYGVEGGMSMSSLFRRERRFVQEGQSRAGRPMLGLTRSEAGAEKLRSAGAEVLHGNS